MAKIVAKIFRSRRNMIGLRLDPDRPKVNARGPCVPSTDDPSYLGDTRSPTFGQTSNTRVPLYVYRRSNSNLLLRVLRYFHSQNLLCQRICQQTHIISGPFLRDEVSLSFDSATALAVGVYATCTRKAPKIPQKKIYFPIDNNM